MFPWYCSLLQYDRTNVRKLFWGSINLSDYEILYYFPIWNNINLLLVWVSTQYCFIPDFKQILGHGQTSWSSQSTIKASVTCLVGQLQSMSGRLGHLSPVSFTVGKWWVFCKSGQEGIRIMSKNKWRNGLFGAKCFLGAVSPLNLVQFTAPKVVTPSLRFFLYAYATSL